MTGWGARLAAIRARRGHAEIADSSATEAIGTNDTIGIGMETVEADAVAARIAFYVRFQAEAAAALAGREPDPIEAAERAAVFGGEGAAMTQTAPD